jgi:N-acetylglucosaminyldiphosphoundecaprenol N-acetyl-beta-D-mannosaminyltransferase
MMSTSTPASIRIHGIRLVNLAIDEALAAIEAALAARQATRISFVNADCVNIAAVNATYREALAETDWVFIDGIGMRIAGKMMDQPVRDNVNGTDLFPRLCESLAQQGKRLFLFGARPGVAAAAAEWALAHYPGLQIAGTRHGYHPAEAESETLAIIRASGADLVLVALGTPHQETWIARNMAASGATVALGVGGLFDYYSGRIPRAPMWIRRCGLEWLFRLIQEPRRLWRRYVVGNVIFLVRIGMDWLRVRGRRLPTDALETRRAS